MPSMNKPGGEINDPKDIDVDFSDIDSSMEDDASEISSERNNPPERINHINNK